MKITILVLIVVATLTVAWKGQGVKQDNGTVQERQEDKPSEMKLSNLLTQTLSEKIAKNREIIVSYVEIPPNTTMDRHWHPGEEFHYYLDGKVTIDLGDGKKIDGTPGKVGHVPYKMLHTAITGDEGARLVVFRVHEKGKPVRYLEDGTSQDK